MCYCKSTQKSSQDVQREYCSTSLMGALPVAYSHMDVIMHHNYDLLLYFTSEIAVMLLLKHHLQNSHSQIPVSLTLMKL